MPETDLTRRDRLILLTLTVMDKPAVTNADLKAAGAAAIEKANRERLAAAQLIEASMVNRAWQHELTDAGWARSAEEMTTTAPKGSDSSTRLLYLHLRRWNRYMSGSGLKIADIYGNVVEGEAPLPVTDRIRLAYQQLVQRQGDWANLAELRNLLHEASRADVDQALMLLDQEGAINLAPNPDQRRLSQADHDAAIQVGGTAHHLIIVKNF